MSAQILVTRADVAAPKSRSKALLEQPGEVEDPRDPWRMAHRLDEILFLLVSRRVYDLHAASGRRDA